MNQVEYVLVFMVLAKQKLFDLFRRALKIEFIRFAIVGVIATVLHYGVYYLLLIIINVNLAYSAGYLVSLLCNFYLSSVFTFNSKANVKKGVGFVFSHLINYLLHMLFLTVFLHLGIPEKLAPIPVIFCVFPINFLLVRTVFKSKWFQR